MRSIVIVLLLGNFAAAEPIAIGLAPSTYKLSDGSRGFAPEVFAHSYVTLGHRFAIRPGMRLGGRGLTQPEMPVGVRITERDFTSQVEAAITFSGPVVPSLAIMGGLDVRSIGIEGNGIGVAMSHTAGTELLPYIAVQTGVGLPIAHGTWLVEPTIRREFLFGDARPSWRFGLEVSYLLPVGL